MKYLYIASFLSILSSVNAQSSTKVITAPANRPTISSELYNELDTLMKYASAAYASCAEFVGNATVDYLIDQNSTDTQGYIAHNDARKEIIVAFRGTTNSRDFNTDYNLGNLNYTTPGFKTACEGCTSHAGFTIAYQSVGAVVLDVVSQLHAKFPSYTIKTTGHSLGGALSSLAYAALAEYFTDADVKGYAYGQPQTGDDKWADFVDNLSGQGTNFFRTNHADDGVPLLLPIYRHLLTEYWQLDPASPSNTYKCEGRLDPECNQGAGGQGINNAHLLYFGRGIFDGSLCSQAPPNPTGPAATIPVWAPGPEPSGWTLNPSNPSNPTPSSSSPSSPSSSSAGSGSSASSTKVVASSSSKVKPTATSAPASSGSSASSASSASSGASSSGRVSSKLAPSSKWVTVSRSIASRSASASGSGSSASASVLRRKRALKA